MTAGKTLSRRIGTAVLGATASIVMMGGAASPAAAVPSTSALWLCAAGNYETYLNARYIIASGDRVGKTFASFVVRPGQDCWKYQVPFGTQVRINVRVLPQDTTIKTFTYDADMGMVIKAAGTSGDPSIQRYRKQF
ncbi:hypothetical protein ACWDG1_46440 [Streptomyces sp. NPDC001177]